MKENVVKNKSFDFAVRIVNLYKHLVEVKKEYVMAKQLLRSGTSAGALIREAEHAESKNDFIHKMAVAQKEINETLYWLELLKTTGYLTNEQFSSINTDAEEKPNFAAIINHLSLTINYYFSISGLSHS
jgi:four helix bundle protein